MERFNVSSRLDKRSIPPTISLEEVLIKQFATILGGKILEKFATEIKIVEDVDKTIRADLVLYVGADPLAIEESERAYRPSPVASAYRPPLGKGLLMEKFTNWFIHTKHPLRFSDEQKFTVSYKDIVNLIVEYLDYERGL